MKLTFINKYNRVLFIIFLLFSSFIYSHHFWRRSTFLVDPYWFDHWLLNYSFGFVRRGLLGSILNFLGGLQHSILFVNLLAVVITLSIVILFIRQLVAFFAVNSLVSLIFIFVCILSPLISVFFECCGDPFQLTLLITFLLIHLITKYNLNIVSKFIVFTVLMSINMLIHEASLFISGFLFIFALLEKKSDRASFKNLSLRIIAIFCYSFVLLSLMCFIIWKGTINEQKKEHLIKEMFAQSQFIKADYHTSKNSIILKSIKEEQKESDFYQASFRKSTIPIIEKFLRIIAIPFLLCNLFLLVLCIHRNEIHMRFYKYLFYFYFFSFPLYIAAHDWGRFSMYTLCLIIYLFCKIHSLDPRTTLLIPRDESYAPQFLVEDEKRNITASYVLARKVLFLTIIILTIHPINITYRISGLSHGSFVIFLFVGLPLLFLVNLTDRQ